MSYNDVLSMPTFERRYFLGLLTKEFVTREEKAQDQKSVSGSGKRVFTGNELKNRMNSGDIPLI
jgi:hypothetical protein